LLPLAEIEDEKRTYPHLRFNAGHIDTDIDIDIGNEML